jgi:hypothetical protein
MVTPGKAVLVFVSLPKYSGAPYAQHQTKAGEAYRQQLDRDRLGHGSRTSGRGFAGADDDLAVTGLEPGDQDLVYAGVKGAPTTTGGGEKDCCDAAARAAAVAAAAADGATTATEATASEAPARAASCETGEGAAATAKTAGTAGTEKAATTATARGTGPTVTAGATEGSARKENTVATVRASEAGLPGDARMPENTGTTAPPRR